MHRIAQGIAVTDHLSVDKDQHMLPNSALLVEDIPSRHQFIAEVVFEDGTTRPTFDLILKQRWANATRGSG